MNRTLARSLVLAAVVAAVAAPSASAKGGTGGGTGKVSLQDFHFVQPAPAARGGVHVAMGDLNGGAQPSDPAPMRIKLTDILITSYR